MFLDQVLCLRLFVVLFSAILVRVAGFSRQSICDVRAPCSGGIDVIDGDGGGGGGGGR